MQFTIQFQGKEWKGNFQVKYDISIPLKSDGVRAFHAPAYEVSPFVAGDFIGDIKEGSPVNFKNILINPHGNGTHTECLSHVVDEDWSINQALKEFNHVAVLISVAPNKEGEDEVIDLTPFKDSIKGFDALIIRTLPNGGEKLSKDHSATNPPYLTSASMQVIVDAGVKHLLLDVPSVDKEQDGGEVANHKLFWNLDGEAKKHHTITEMIYVSDLVKDGVYLLNLQIISLEEIDASPSKPIIYPLSY